MAFHKWAQQDLNLRPSDYEAGSARSPVLLTALLLGFTLVGDGWGSWVLLLRSVTVRLCPAPSVETPPAPIRRRGIPCPGIGTLAIAHRESMRES